MVLLWLVPTVVVTVAAMLWVSWIGREGRGEVDREVALQRMAKVLDPASARGLGRWRRRRTPSAPATVTARRDRSTGVAVRPSRPVRPADQVRSTGPDGDDRHRDRHREQRRAS